MWPFHRSHKVQFDELTQRLSNVVDQMTDDELRRRVIDLTIREIVVDSKRALLAREETRARDKKNANS